MPLPFSIRSGKDFSNFGIWKKNKFPFTQK